MNEEEKRAYRRAMDDLEDECLKETKLWNKIRTYISKLRKKTYEEEKND